MKNSLPSLACFAAIAWCTCGGTQAAMPNAADAPGAPAASVLPGDALMARVVGTVDRAPSISARLRHRVEMVGHPLLGTGRYLQQGRGPRRAFRLEMELRTVLSGTSIEQICDGDQLWMFEEFDSKKSLSVVDVVRLSRARRKSQTPEATVPVAWLKLGGLPRLLENMHEAFRFSEVTEGRLDELPVWSIDGGWKPERLAQLLPGQAVGIRRGQPADLSPLTPNIPHRVVLHVGCDDLFPYRIEYWRTEPGEEGASPQEKLMLVMELYEVQLGARIDPAEFVYRPPSNLRPQDRTAEFLNRLGLEDPPPVEARRQLRSPL